MGKVKTAFIYCRVSTETQMERGQGLEVQLKLCRDFCKDQGIQIEGEFSDKGISGAAIDREGLQDMLACLNGADLIVVANTSRLWRDDFTRVLIQRELKKAGKDVKAVDNPKYSLYAETPESHLINGMMELLDDYERLSIVLKLKRSRRQKASKGQKASGSAPFGYRWAEVKIDGKRVKVIEIESAEVDQVKEIFNAYLRPEITSLGKLQKHLTKVEVFNRRGKEFGTQALLNILKNDFYIGKVRHGELQAEGQHKPIISPVIFGKVQAALKRNAK